MGQIVSQLVSKNIQKGTIQVRRWRKHFLSAIRGVHGLESQKYVCGQPSDFQGKMSQAKYPSVRYRWSRRGETSRIGQRE